MQKDATANFDGTEAFPQDDPCSQASLEDLCRSHLVKKHISCIFASWFDLFKMHNSFLLVMHSHFFSI